MAEKTILIRGASQNNLKELDLDLPLQRIIAITGVSGSGKSSLALDTLYGEGQRRYVETFSPYARQFMDRMDRPRVDRIEGIPPAIAIDRKDPVKTSRSTVGTMTEINDYVKLLFSRIGILHCSGCRRPVHSESAADVWKTLSEHPEGKPVVLTFPFHLGNAEDSPEKQTEIISDLIHMGFNRIWDGEKIIDLDSPPFPKSAEQWNVVVDRFKLRLNDRKRIIDSVEMSFRFGDGRVDAWIPPGSRLSFSRKLSCPDCNILYTPALPNLFSFNSPIGACENCRGFGRTIDIDLDLIVPDKSVSLEQGAIKPWGDKKNNWTEYRELMKFCRNNRIPVDIPFEKLGKALRQAVIDGTEQYYGVRGFFQWLETKTYKMPVRVFLSRYRSYNRCTICNGTRFKPESLLYLIDGRNIADLYAMTVQEISRFFDEIVSASMDEATVLLLEEIRSRLKYLRNVGLGYLTLDRQSRSLSGGEVQRVALASALGASLVNTLYVLDEPSIGLHPRDTHRLIRILKNIRDLGNTVIIVEHDPDIIRKSDLLLDLGPGAGEKGGRVSYLGPIRKVNNSITGDYLRGKRLIPLPEKRRAPQKTGWLKIQGAKAFNLKNIDVKLPMGLFVCLTGVSGSGKSTLAEEILYKSVRFIRGESPEKPGLHKSITGLDEIEGIHLVDQQAIGRTPRANILTYAKALDPVRNLLAKTPSASERKFSPGHFSFNVKGGRCETCKGDGFERVEMQFLSDVFVTCPDCTGKRFKTSVLEITYRNRNIYDIFSMTVGEAIEFFKDNKKIVSALHPLSVVGLDYIRLGQPLNTLSGGEAQRLKLSRFFGRQTASRQLFIFDEPTTGLHFEDIEKLLTAMGLLVDQGNSVLIIEHNMDVIKAADWIIDLGPEGGPEGGHVVAEGTPEQISKCSASHTGRHLKQYLKVGRPFISLKTEQKKAGGSPGSRPSKPHPGKTIYISGARQHNLKNINLHIPQNKLVAMTGVSGSGKSTLAFDILFAEGQRRYLESLAPYVRQYVKILERPDVDLVSGLSPTVAIEQRISHAGRRSTVATLTEIYHFLRLLFSKMGYQHCPGCKRPLAAKSEAEIIDDIRRRYGNTPIIILAPKIHSKKGYHKEVLAASIRKGFTEARIDGKLQQISPGMALSRYDLHTIEWVVGRLKSARGTDLKKLVGTALEEGNGSLSVLGSRTKEMVYSRNGFCPACGIGVDLLDPRLFSFNSPQGWCPDCEGLGRTSHAANPDHVCDGCQGSRLRKEAIAVTVGSKNIWDFVRLPAKKALESLKKLRFNSHEMPVASPVISEILARLEMLGQLGLDYLPLGQSGNTLSGGEAQRVRLAAQLGSNLTGITYILDEPTIGLHPRDNLRLINALKSLRDRGNTVLVVEHDEETIRAADHIIDLGPGAGDLGGKVVASGSLARLKAAARSVTGALIDGNNRNITSRLRPYRRMPGIQLKGVHANNLKNIRVRIPVGTLICVTGVSGSGKSSLLKDALYQGLKNRLQKGSRNTDFFSAMTGWENVDRLLEVDHSPIGRTPRSVPASYIGILGDIRRLFSRTRESRTRGYSPGRFSFNVRGGRCENCAGHGHPKVEMSFLPDVYVPCEACRGKRFNPDTLEIRYRGKNMAEVLEMSFAESLQFFSAIPNIRRAIQLVCDIGLGYLRLGQPSPTLSGGEAQRIKLAQQLIRPSRGKSFYLLDEPSTGLHLADVQLLLDVLQSLVDAGNTVAMIEHNLELIKAADYIIDLGPEGGTEGGRVVHRGSPVELVKDPKGSYTAQHLRTLCGPGVD